MIWPAMLFNLCVGLLFAGYLLRAVRRFERTADRIEAKMDRAFGEQMRFYDHFLNTLRASSRAKVDRALIEMGGEIQPDRSIGDNETLRYRDSIQTQLRLIIPGHREIHLLPRLARVAFGARCARRVLHLFQLCYWGKTPEEHYLNISHAVEFAEHAGSVGDVAEDATRTANAARQAAYAAEYAAVTHAYPDRDLDPIDADPDFHSEIVSTDRATAAAYAAAYAVDATSKVDNTDSVREAADRAAIATDDDRFIRGDFETLYGLAIANGWTDDTTVPPSVFGPLWPEGSPQDWPKPVLPTTEIVLEFDIPDDTITVNAVAFAKKLAAELSALHVAGGGHGLAIRPPLNLEAPIPARVPDSPLVPV